jgi:hypothetical protein
MFNFKKEKRRFVRLPAHHLIKYKVVGREALQGTLSFVRNISAAGVLFHAQENIPSASTLELEINFPLRSEPIKVLAKTLRVKPLRKTGGYDIALEFLNLDKDTCTFINKKILEVYGNIKRNNKPRRQINKLKSGLLIILAVFFSLSAINSYAAIGRDELITYTLDYYTSGGKLDKKLFAEQRINKQRDVDTAGGRKIEQEEPRMEKKNWVIVDRARAYLKNIHPYTKLNAQHHSNLYLVPSEPKEDFAATTQAGLLFNTKLAKKKVEVYLDGGEEIIKYSSQTVDNTDHPYARGLLKADLGKWKLAFMASVDKQRSTESLLENIGEPNFVDFWIYNYGSSTKFNLKRFESELQYQHTGISYVDNQYVPSNNNTDILAIKNSYKILPRTKIFVDYAHGWLDYYKNNNNSWNYDRYWAGIESKFLRKFASEIKYGYIASNPKVGRHETGNTFSTKLEYKPSSRLACYTQAINGLGVSDLLNSSVTKVKKALLGINYLPLSNNKRLRLQTEISYREEHYEPDSRQKYFNVFFRPEYKLKKWLTLGLNYNYNERRSNIKTQEYIDNNVAFTLDCEF